MRVQSCLLMMLLCVLPAALPAIEYHPVDYYTNALQVSPVARPMGTLTATLNANPGSPNFKRLILPAPAGEQDTIFVWRVQNLDGRPGWAAMRFCWEVGRPANGIQLDFTMDAGRDKLKTEFFAGCDPRNKGFFAVRHLVKDHTVPVSSDGSRQTLRILFKDLKLPAKDAADINAMGLVLGGAGEIHFHRISLLYDDQEAADAVGAELREKRDERLASGQETMLKALSYRGIDSEKIAAVDDLLLREKLLWAGWDLLAQQRQIEVFSEWTAALAPQLSRPDFASRNQRLRDDLQQNAASYDAEAVAELQAEVDAWIDQVLAAIPPDKRRYTLGADGRFYDPAGKPYRFYGPFFFRAMFHQDTLIAWRKADMRYLAALGFNGIRLFVQYADFEPIRGQADPQNVARNLAIMHEAERYGLAVSIDLHWAYPKWFLDGPDDVAYPEGVSRNHHNSYRWDDALVESWRLLGASFKECPNIVAFEVPTNETPLANDPAGLTAFPGLMAQWNAWLKNQYRDRDALANAWGNALVAPSKYALRDNESWDDNSIMPMGFQGEDGMEEIAFSNPRLQDFLRFAAWKQQSLSGRIVEALRENIPDAYGMSQRTIGDIWDKSKSPIDYRAILTCFGKNVIVGTHYDMGSLQAEKACSLAMASFDSEQQMENYSRGVEAQVKLGNGFSPFAFDNIGKGGMLFIDHDWHLKPSVLHLMKNSEWIRNYWPPKSDLPLVAVISNSRLESAGHYSLHEFVKALREAGYQPKVFESMRVAEEPGLLKGIPLAITTSSYLDTRLLDVLASHYDGKVCLYGRMDIDAYASALAPAFIQRRLFLDSSQMVKLGNRTEIDLRGDWNFRKAPATAHDDRMRQPHDGELVAETRKAVPKLWGELGLTGSLQYYVGDAWMWRYFDVPENWQGREVLLRIGAIDDLDWVWVNGNLVGHTGEDTGNYWLVERNYPIPPGTLKYGRKNLIVVGVRNLWDDGGIYRDPVVLIAHEAGKNDNTNALQDNLPPVAISLGALRGDVQVLSSSTGKSGEQFPLAIRQGRFTHFLTENPRNIISFIGQDQ